jgi:hypothetical protein
VRHAQLWVLLFLGLSIGASASASQCSARSGARTAALVELYTAQSCTTCRPAEQWLAGLHAPGRVVPVALHVDYRDYVAAPAPRRKLTPRQRLALAYTPRVLLQGRDYRGWGSDSFDEALASINAIRPRAALRLDIVSQDAQGVRVAMAAELLQPADAVLYLAAYENRSERYVVLEWLGPFRFSGTKLQAERLLPLLPRAMPANSGVVGFVQDRRSAEVLQALMLAAC